MAGIGGARPNSGRPKGSKNRYTATVAKAIADYAETHLPEHLDVLHQIILHGEKDRDRVAALTLLWTRAWGRPTENIDLSVTGDATPTINDLLNVRAEEGDEPGTG